MYKFTKKWGQVFLKNKDIQKKIANYINSIESDTLVEIGPGDGALTQYIDYSGKSFSLVEIDPRLIPFLRGKFPLVDVIHGDFLDKSIVFQGENILLFGNIPYCITSQIFIRFLNESCFSNGVFMIQQECFETISASPGTKKYSSFSALLQSLVVIKKVIKSNRKNFFPVPKVDSIVVHLIKKSIILEDFSSYSDFLRASFSMPRKTLWNNLKKFILEDLLIVLFEKNNLDKNIRPDSVCPDLYRELWESYFLSK